MIQDNNGTCSPMELKPIPYGKSVKGYLSSHLVQGDVESVEVETLGEGRGRRKEGRDIRLCIKQTKLSTLQVSFHQCNFCRQNNKKGKGKVYELLVKHRDVRGGVRETQTVEAEVTEQGLRRLFVLRKSQKGKYT